MTPGRAEEANRGTASRMARDASRAGGSPTRVARWPLARELATLGSFALLYAGVRAITEGSTASAVANAQRILRLEQWLGIAWEESVQAAVIGSDTAVAVTNWVYIWGYWPVILASAVYLWRRHRDHYLLLRRAVLLSGFAGLLVFALLPTAPPRLADIGVVDTILEQSRSYRVMQPAEVTNQYAAMPSLHVGWSLLIGIVVAVVVSNRIVRSLSLMLPLAMSFAVVATANHFVLDVVVGIVVVLAALAVVAQLTGPRPVVAATLDGGGRRVAVSVPGRAPRRRRRPVAVPDPPTGRRLGGHGRATAPRAASPDPSADTRPGDRAVEREKRLPARTGRETVRSAGRP